MAELFQADQPEVALSFTGERLVTGLQGEIESEHLHRYFVAREICRGKEVLDIASGEGYGTALLAQTAKRATGVEIDIQSVTHASHSYKHQNLRYIQGEATSLPMETASVDVVTSFETLEHFLDHETFLAEVRRVLRPSGLLIISTPDSSIYSATGTLPNPFHVRELTWAEFAAALNAVFKHVSFFRQRVIKGSAILADRLNSGTPGIQDGAWIYEKRGDNVFEAHKELPRAPYLLAIASDVEFQRFGPSLYFETEDAATSDERERELERLQSVEAAVREQGPALTHALSEAARLAALVETSEAEIKRLEMSNSRLEILSRQFETASLLSRQQGLMIQSLQRELSSQGLSHAQRMEEEVARGRLIQQRADEDFAREQLTAQRTAEQEIALRQELASLWVAYNRVCRLIVPIRIRKALPGVIKSPLRALKRTLLQR